MNTYSIILFALARFGLPLKLPDSVGGWFALISLGIALPVLALYIKKRMKKIS